MCGCLCWKLSFFMMKQFEFLSLLCYNNLCSSFWAHFANFLSGFHENRFVKIWVLTKKYLETLRAPVLWKKSRLDEPSSFWAHFLNLLFGFPWGSHEEYLYLCTRIFNFDNNTHWDIMTWLFQCFSADSCVRSCFVMLMGHVLLWSNATMRGRTLLEVEHGSTTITSIAMKLRGVASARVYWRMYPIILRIIMATAFWPILGTDNNKYGHLTGLLFSLYCSHCITPGIDWSSTVKSKSTLVTDKYRNHADS